MATPWHEDQTWPTDYREHAAKLSTYLQKALSSIENTTGPPIEPRKVKHSFFGALNLIVKVQSLPDLALIHEAIRNAQHETKTAAQNTSKAISDIRDELKTANKISQQTITKIQDNANVALATGATAKEAVEIGKATYKMVKDMKPGATPSQSNMAQTYASIVARGGLAASMHNPVNHRASPVQAQREIIVNTRDPVTITNIRAMSPLSLKAHVDRAIEQGNNEHINKIKVVSSNQLKSGDPSIKSMTSAETEALRQFAEDWEHRIGNGAIHAATARKIIRPESVPRRTTTRRLGNAPPAAENTKRGADSARHGRKKWPRSRPPTRSRHHSETPVPFISAVDNNQARTKDTTRPGRPTLEPSQSQGARPGRSRSPTKKIQKRQVPTSSQQNDENGGLNINVISLMVYLMRSHQAFERTPMNCLL
ncbi:hypothetical protein Purlil1_13478 [Purpureocillium lilacinum]|uniref:Uncharacterized protein n=1 Tax=Purpureocillium lilacinum TaxID=33203 RepID=A0ABR0BEN0_PURLI|nr:hypothetical protein Purlil1_13478 [Purpureocillium lilacinum]